MANEWDKYAKTWEDEQATSEFASHVFEQLTQLTNLKGKHVLDFGCGTGLLSHKMSSIAKDIVALDSSEAMIEQLDMKELANVEPVVDELTRGLVAQHPAFRNQFDVVVASSVCGFLPSFSETADVIYSILDSEGIFVHWDWLTEQDEDFGLTQTKVEQVLTSVGFDSVTVSKAFDIQTEHGVQSVVMGVGQKK
ncbi:class I SAM-dependent DNA methyltransferase [Vibrio genomosp. F10]|uniref:SAM-dependent methyltransferase n=2 Tax=Vibrio genomosp. F10 TaxID=723171 RepID=A0A1B9R091_9VIBR|nr:methyltransferase domain-containing protein [Vibrio genomosp. F10]OCH77076.1 SAM-dependent methyltransferase [Vibrio genomosp. F10]OEE32710.1 SAM-dependent methyltransferase [Vibrio genomosp. F10 str. ZF-129]OEE86992.1 SAM-dependent methyltransferase [Vibrio genomosp. F10 str. 9ZD137]OEE94356.1 SAM-dependent methyltransferase [Vibrio genomosp. F10 str. 9ZC157]OEF05478.1 SAM-dependent methyltransferase [Vibrio genomosp. F10 str. 9ZB36]